MHPVFFRILTSCKPRSFTFQWQTAQIIKLLRSAKGCSILHKLVCRHLLVQISLWSEWFSKENRMSYYGCGKDLRPTMRDKKGLAFRENPFPRLSRLVLDLLIWVGWWWLSCFRLLSDPHVWSGHQHPRLLRLADHGNSSTGRDLKRKEGSLVCSLTHFLLLLTFHNQGSV